MSRHGCQHTRNHRPQTSKLSRKLEGGGRVCNLLHSTCLEMQLLEVLELVLDALLVLRGGEGRHDVCSSASSSLPSRSQWTASFWMGKGT